MDDKILVRALIQLGIDAYQQAGNHFADPGASTALGEVSVATVATLLEELGKFHLIGDVKPVFRCGSGGLVYRLSEEGIRICNQPGGIDSILDRLFPSLQETYDIFLSYYNEDAVIALEIKIALQLKGINCFMAGKDLPAGSIWEDRIRSALVSARKVLLLLTPRSKDRPWVLIEAGAAWALHKEVIPLLMFVNPAELIDPIRRFQARTIESREQRDNLVAELASRQ